MVGERRFVEVGGAVGPVGSETAVAKVRVGNIGGRRGCIGAAYRQRNRVTLEAISYKLLQEEELKHDRFSLSTYLRQD